jgi:hypothetical protein
VAWRILRSRRISIWSIVCLLPHYLYVHPFTHPPFQTPTHIASMYLPTYLSIQGPALHCIFSHNNLVHTVIRHVFRNHFSIIFRFKSRSSKHSFFIYPIQATFPAHVELLHMTVLVILNCGNDEAPQYAIFCILLLLPPQSIQL